MGGGFSCLSSCSEGKDGASTATMGFLTGATIGLGAAVIGAPLVLSAVGFMAAGIAAGSLAAKMMSAAAIANGGGVAAGSLVALGQSAGMAGLSVATKAAITATGVVVGLLV
ncbi:interferon alpha-inducible protein 27-like protein 2A isoform X3 [Pantherophis guttatus]|uniref:Interferon alpha-inducible protein 27-like protein 2A isoform X3 n=1 Tax=Pantherophis guttatus TaxID=94885 RepID=A0A6P9BMC2_PANGU|nr:interferon alpha-inducible protein 27-like protein 2A isoform X3 [Pantherophis guttatus]